LNQKTCGDNICHGNAVNFSSLQLFEEATHDIGVRTLIIMSCRVRQPNTRSEWRTRTIDEGCNELQEREIQTALQSQ
jgi:hypothetical protein